jgi:hypothetical protein
VTCDALQLRVDDSLADCGVAPGSLLRVLPRSADEERAAASAAAGSRLFALASVVFVF